MQKHTLLGLINQYEKQYPEEYENIYLFKQLLITNINCFDKSSEGDHITGSAWIINNEGTHTLLTHHRKLNRWLQLGGHADGNSNIRNVALREVKEESSLTVKFMLHDNIFDLDIHEIPSTDQILCHKHYDIRFAMRVVGSNRYKVTKESNDLKWVKIGKLSEFTQDISILRMERKWQQKSYYFDNEIKNIGGINEQ